MTGGLTIVIPFYKLRYLKAALDSFCTQTQKDFTLFIGDDASPENPLPLLEQYQGRLRIDYHRFDKNLGGTSLARHWNRCVEKTSSEWVWLFSDDDLAGEYCCEAFEKELLSDGGGHDVYRFNTRVIDANDQPLYAPTPATGHETAEDALLAKPEKNRSSFAVEYIFRRKAFDAAGGFIDLPMAWFSDDASWYFFAKNTGIKTISGGSVDWRLSQINLSSPKPESMGIKLQAFRKFLQLIDNSSADPAFATRMRVAYRKWLPDQIQFWGGKPGLGDGLRFWWFFVQFTGHPNLLLLRTFLGLTGLKQQAMTAFGLQKAHP